MDKRLLLRLLAGLALTFAPVAEAAAPAGDASSGLPTIQDLLDTCQDASAAAQAACKAYVNATIQTAEIMRAAANGGTPAPLFCPKGDLRPEDLVALIRLELTAHPERKALLAPAAIIGAGVENYPCPKAAGSSPARKAPARPAHRRR